MREELVGQAAYGREKRSMSADLSLDGLLLSRQSRDLGIELVVGIVQVTELLLENGRDVSRWGIRGLKGFSVASSGCSLQQSVDGAHGDGVKTRCAYRCLFPRL